MASSPDSPLRLRRLSVAPQGVRRAYLGHAQLSLVEHALCPLDAASALGHPFLYETQYAFTDENRHRRAAHVRVACPEGLSATDEFYLWGLLSLTFSQPKPSADLFATPYYCLRQLGCVDQGEGRTGGRRFDLFRDSISRLSTVSYRNDRFYDPIRGEHRDVGFGFLSYSLPIDLESSRAWRFAWDPIFYEFCQAVSGALRFDFQTYRELDPATRRLYLLLKKIFWRNDTSPEFDLRELAVNVIGFSTLHETWKLKQKVVRCIEVLLAHHVIRLPDAVSHTMLFTKRAKGQYAIRFYRGSHFEQTAASSSARLLESPLYEPLHTIGLDEAVIRHILKMYDARLIAECADMTLAAKERFGDSFFTSSPQAYFMDNIKAQASRTRTPPDWWRELRKEEDRKRWQADHAEQASSGEFEKAFDAYLQTDAREAFDRVMDRIFQDLKSAGQTDTDARQQASHFARTHFVSRFRAEHPEWKDTESM